MRKFSRRGVSPIIATILMVVITIILSATIVVMVMGFNSTGGSTHYGSIALVAQDSSAQYTVYFGGFQPKTLFSQVKASIAGHLTDEVLSSYTIQTPYSYPSVVTSMHPVDLGGEGIINAGDSMVISFDSSMAGQVADIAIVFAADGNVIAGTSIIVQGGGHSTLDLTNFVAESVPAGHLPLRAWPLTLDATYKQDLKLTNAVAFQPVNSLTIQISFMLSQPANQELNWSSLVNRGLNNGYRLQLSGPINNVPDNRWLEFGITGLIYVRSNGMRDASSVSSQNSPNYKVLLQQGVQYTAVATYDKAVGKLQLFMSEGGGALQLVGERPAVLTFDTANLPLFIGAHGNSTPSERWFSGTIQYVNIIVT